MLEKQHIIILSFFLSLCFSNSTSCQIEENSLFPNNQIVDEQDISPLEYYKNILAFNDRNKIKYRNTFTHKLDSTYYWLKGFGDIKLIGKSVFYFDNEKLKEHDLSFRLNEETEKLEPNSNNVLTFNKKDLLIRQTYNSWDGNYDDLNELDPLVLRQYYYNENQQIIKLEEQDWYDISINVIPIFRTYEYDSLGLLSANNRFRWFDDINEYSKTDVIEYRYNENNQLEQIVKRAISLLTEWAYLDSTVLVYNDENLLAKETRYSIDLTDGLYLNEETVYEYNSDKTLREKIMYENFRESQQKWFKEIKTNYTYDTTGKLKQTAQYIKELSDYDWELWQEKKYHHDDNLSSQNTQIPKETVSNFYYFLTDFSKINALTLYQEFSGEAGYLLSLTTQYKYFYSPIITSTIDNISTQYPITISPNPTSDWLKVEVDNYNGMLNIIILDTQGKLVSENKIKSGEQLSVAELDSGVYFYRIQIGADVVGGKFVKID